MSGLGLVTLKTAQQQAAHDPVLHSCLCFHLCISLTSIYAAIPIPISMIKWSFTPIAQQKVIPRMDPRVQAGKYLRRDFMVLYPHLHPSKQRSHPSNQNGPRKRDVLAQGYGNVMGTITPLPKQSVTAHEENSNETNLQHDSLFTCSTKNKREEPLPIQKE